MRNVKDVNQGKPIKTRNTKSLKNSYDSFEEQLFYVVIKHMKLSLPSSLHIEKKISLLEYKQMKIFMEKHDI
jgi:hypothetical protein